MRHAFRTHFQGWVAAMTAACTESHPKRVAGVLRAGLDAITGRPDDGRVPSLDFLRTMAVLSVVCGHWASGFRRADGVEVGMERLPFFHFGWVGVDIFFVLSGYLIGRQLWKEAAVSKTVVFPRFFARRALRIWPLYFFICFVVTIFPLPGEGPVGIADILFFSNYAQSGLGGAWSLSTEEQFYILAPLLVIALGRRIPLRGFFVILAVLAAITSLNRYFTYTTSVVETGDLSTLYFAIHLHNDGLPVGLAPSRVPRAQRAFVRHVPQPLRADRGAPRAVGESDGRLATSAVVSLRRDVALRPLGAALVGHVRAGRAPLPHPARPMDGPQAARGAAADRHRGLVYCVRRRGGRSSACRLSIETRAVRQVGHRGI
ncbi:acyltransferase family protein [Sorangium sp. So ce145]|uniref:acyltransferase family protein n=1 Tax=Sorangium sp. So ce145 TaxID=3133285 RepID=UPI003F5EDAEC